MSRTSARVMLAAFAAAAASVTAAAPSHAMFGAPEADAGDPLTAPVVSSFNGKSLCTSTLIAPQWVITAAHCVNGGLDVGTTISFGQDLKNPTEQRKVTEVYKHDTFDAALYKLDSPVTDVAPAALYQGTTDAPVGTATVAYGWGRLPLIGSNDHLDRGTGAIVETKQPTIGAPFQNMVGINNKLDGSMKIVPGDSGGPLFIDGKLYGIVSGGGLNPDVLVTSTTTVYSQIPAIHDWIVGTVGADVFNPAPTSSTPTSPTDSTSPSTAPTSTGTTNTSLPDTALPITSGTDLPSSASTSPSTSDTMTSTSSSTSESSVPTSTSSPSFTAPRPTSRAPFAAPVSDGTEAGTTVDTGGQVEKSLWEKIAGLFR